MTSQRCLQLKCVFIVFCFDYIAELPAQKEKEENRSRNVGFMLEPELQWVYRPPVEVEEIFAAEQQPLNYNSWTHSNSGFLIRHFLCYLTYTSDKKKYK